MGEASKGGTMDATFIAAAKALLTAGHTVPEVKALVDEANHQVTRATAERLYGAES